MTSPNSVALALALRASLRLAGHCADLAYVPHLSAANASATASHMAKDIETVRALVNALALFGLDDTTSRREDGGPA